MFEQRLYQTDNSICRAAPSFAGFDNSFMPRNLSQCNVAHKHALRHALKIVVVNDTGGITDAKGNITLADVASHETTAGKSAARHGDCLQCGKFWRMLSWLVARIDERRYGSVLK